MTQHGPLRSVLGRLGLPFIIHRERPDHASRTRAFQECRRARWPCRSRPGARHKKHPYRYVRVNAQIFIIAVIHLVRDGIVEEFEIRPRQEPPHRFPRAPRETRSSPRNSPGKASRCPQKKRNNSLDQKRRIVIIVRKTAFVALELFHRRERFLNARDRVLSGDKSKIVSAHDRHQVNADIRDVGVIPDHAPSPNGTLSPSLILSRGRPCSVSVISSKNLQVSRATSFRNALSS